MNSIVQQRSTPSSNAAALRIASVSYLNATPLIYGIDRIPNRKLQLDVPARLIDLLRQDHADVALLPVIDYQRLDDLCIVPTGGIGCNGETLTVRIFSKTPIEQIQTLACDTESHTSVALAKIVLAEHFGVKVEFGERGQGSGVGVQGRDGAGNASDLHCNSLTPEPCPLTPSALLLIGDKVVCEEPKGYPHQLDLGDAWKKMTGLPFVFAVWTTRVGTNLGDLPEQLERAKREGLEHVDALIERYAVPRGWPAGLARQYLTSYLQFDIGQPQLEAIRLFHGLAAKHGIIPDARALQVYSPDSPQTR